MKCWNNVSKALKAVVSNFLSPFAAVLGVAFIIFGIIGTLVAQLKGVNSLLHAATVVTLLFVLFCVVKRFQEYVAAPPQVFSLNKKKVGQLTIGSLLALAISFFCLCFLYLYKGAYTLDYAAPLLPTASISILLSFIVAAFFEELIMRYFLLGLLLKNKWSFAWSVIISSAFFSYIHNYQSESEEWYLYVHAAAFLIGIFFCLLYWAYGSFWLVVFTHAIWNLINGLFYEDGASIFLVLHELEDTEYILFFSIIYAVLCTLIFLFYKKASKKHQTLSQLMR